MRLMSIKKIKVMVKMVDKMTLPAGIDNTKNKDEGRATY